MYAILFKVMIGFYLLELLVKKFNRIFVRSIWVQWQKTKKNKNSKHDSCFDQKLVSEYKKERIILNFNWFEMIWKFRENWLE